MITISPKTTIIQRQKKVFTWNNVQNFKKQASANSDASSKSIRSNIRRRCNGKMSQFCSSASKSSKKATPVKEFEFDHSKAIANYNTLVAQNTLMSDRLRDKINYFYKPYDAKGAVGVPLTMVFEDPISCPDSQAEQVYASHAKRTWKKLSSNIIGKDNEIFRNFLNGVNSSLYANLKQLDCQQYLPKVSLSKRFKSVPPQRKPKRSQYLDEGINLLSKVLLEEKRPLILRTNLQSPDLAAECSETETKFSLSNDALITPLIMLARGNKEMLNSKRFTKSRLSQAETMSSNRCGNFSDKTIGLAIPKRKTRTSSRFMKDSVLQPMLSNLVPGNIEESFDKMTSPKNHKSTKVASGPKRLKSIRSVTRRLNSNFKTSAKTCGSCKTVQKLEKRLFRLKKRNALKLRIHQQKLNSQINTPSIKIQKVSPEALSAAVAHQNRICCSPSLRSCSSVSEDSDSDLVA